MALNVYIDESGDQGWILDLEYRSGGSSKYYSCAFLVLPVGLAGKTKKIVREVHHEYRMSTKKEIKGSMLGKKARKAFVTKVLELLEDYPEIRIRIVILQKSKVPMAMREVQFNMIRGYMTFLGIQNSIHGAMRFDIIPDKISSSKIHPLLIQSYLQSRLWFEHHFRGVLTYTPKDSRGNENLMFIDWISHLCWRSFEDRENEEYIMLREKLDIIHVIF